MSVPRTSDSRAPKFSTLVSCTGDPRGNDATVARDWLHCGSSLSCWCKVPLMSKPAGGDRWPSADPMDVNVLCLNGEGCMLRLLPSTSAWEVYNMVSRPLRQGEEQSWRCTTVLHRCPAKHWKSKAEWVRVRHCPAHPNRFIYI